MATGGRYDEMYFHFVCGVLNDYELTEWNRVFLERLVVVPLFKKLSEFYGNKRSVNLAHRRPSVVAVRSDKSSESLTAVSVNNCAC